MASKSNKGEILAKFFDDGEYTALFADGAVSAACGYAAGQQAYAVYQNGEAVSVKDVEKNIKVLELAAQTGCPVVTFYDSVGAKLAEGLDVLNAAATLNATIAKVSGVIPQIAVVTGVCGGTSALSAANADVCVMAEDAELFFTAPFTSAAKGDKVPGAGTAEAAAKAGVATIVAANAEEAAEKAAHIVGLLPANNLTGPAIFEFEQPTSVLSAGAAPEKAAAALLAKDSAVALNAGFGTAVVRAIFSIPGHAMFGVVMGFYLSRAKWAEKYGQRHRMRAALRRSFFVSAVLHGLYDFLLMGFESVFYFYFAGLVIGVIRLLRKSAREDGPI